MNGVTAKVATFVVGSGMCPSFVIKVAFKESSFAQGSFATQQAAEEVSVADGANGAATANLYEKFVTEQYPVKDNVSEQMSELCGKDVSVLLAKYVVESFALPAHQDEVSGSGYVASQVEFETDGEFPSTSSGDHPAFGYDTRCCTKVALDEYNGVLATVAVVAFEDQALCHGTTVGERTLGDVVEELGVARCTSGSAEKFQLEDVLSYSPTAGCHSSLFCTTDSSVMQELGVGNETQSMDVTACSSDIEETHVPAADADEGCDMGMFVVRVGARVCVVSEDLSM